MSARVRPTARGCAAVLALALCALVPAPSRAVAGVVVKPGALGVWSVVNRDHSTGIESDQPTSSGTRGDFVDGPRPGPAGIGSFRQRVGDESDSQRVESGVLAGTRLDAIGDLSYWTYVGTGVGTGGAGRSTQIQLMVDMNGDGRFRTAEDDVLTYEPAHNGGPGRSVWQSWNAAGGGWWSLRAGTYGPPLTTLTAYQAAHPAARVAAEVPGLRLTAGGDGLSWEGFDGNFDRVRVAGTEYDFESFFVLADCSATADDIGEVQRAVDAAPPGYGVRLRGVCDFSAAAAHGGTTTSIAAAAVVLGSVSPARDMTISSDGAARSARVVGSGTQAAFFVPPGAANITIRGLAFSSLARPIVVSGASNVTIGDPGSQTPDPDGNSISGGATMNSAVLAVAAPGAGGSLTVAYGAGGARTATYPAGPASSLSGLTVAGNRIVYEAAGVPDAARNLIGVDVRQTGAATAAGVTIARNAIWFATNEFRSFDMNAIRVQGSAATVPSVQNVSITDNTLGRPEDVGEPAPPTSAAGRIGILVHRAGGVTIARNAVRTRASATGVNVPSGGIVAAETTGTLVDANTVSVVAEPGTEAADLGAIGVVDDLGVLTGEAPAAPVSTSVEVRGNTIGQTGSGAQRGIVVAGTTWADVHGNDVVYAAERAIAIGAEVRGAGASVLPRAVATSVLCDNTLEGVTDDPNQVSATEVTAGNFPGGSLIPTNGECLPAGIAIVETDGVTSPSEAGATDEYAVALERRPRAGVTVTIAGGPQATAAPATLTFTPSDWFTPQAVVVTAAQDSLPEGTHLQALVHRAASADDDYDGIARTVLARIVDDDPGRALIVESGGSTAVTEGGAADTYTIVLGSRPGADVTVTARTPVQIRAQPSGVTFTQADWSIPRTITLSALDDTLREGPHVGTLAHSVSSDDPNFHNTPVAGIVATVTDNDVPAAPVVLIPTDNSTVRSSSLIVTGTGERQATVELTEGGVPFGSVVVPSTGRWSAGPFAFAEGTHTVQARQTDPNGFRSAATTRTFRVDLTPPSAPVILAPAEGAVLPIAHVVVRGTSEPDATIVVAEGATTRSTRSSAHGEWAMTVLYAQGPHQIVAYVVDGGGNAGPSSPVRSFTVAADGIPPDPPVILTPAEGSVVPRRVRFTGTTEPNAGVQFWEGSIPVGAATAGSDGFFDTTIEVTPNEPGTPISRQWFIQARAMDASFNLGQFGAVRSFFVDDSPPTVSVRRGLGVLVGIVPPTQEVTAFGTATDNHGVERVELTYTDVRGRTIVRDAVITDVDGPRAEWEDRADLEPGRYVVLAYSYDVAGNRSRRGSSSEILRL